MYRINLFLLLLPAALFTACEKEFVPDISTEPPEVVVEGYIEAGDRPVPPYVVLTRSVPFFSELDADQLNDIFIHGARVTVSDGGGETLLSELCLEDLSPEQQQLAAALLGRPVDSLGFNFCAYLDLSGRLTGVAGKRYDLKVEVENRVITATTTIPPLVPLDTVFFTDPPGEPTDTLAQMRVSMKDPAGISNFYRYFTGENGEGVRAPLNSVFDDRLFDGQDFEFPLLKAEDRNADFDPATFGLYRRGDTITLKWTTIDQPHYDFWSTLEFNAANQGPFSSYTRVSSNIQGGLGIWGGLSAAYYTTIVPK